MPPYLRKKAARNVSAKVTLAARIDSFHESLNGDAGQNLLEELEKKFEKWQEPPPVKEVKALPRPDDAPRQKRGGKLTFERELLWTWLIFFHLGNLKYVCWTLSLHNRSIVITLVFLSVK